MTTQRVKSRFSGKSVAVVARTGPGMGVIKIFINGKRQAIVDLERQAADLERQLPSARSPQQRAELEARLADVNERLSTRRNQVDTVDAPYPSPTRQVGRDYLAARVAVGCPLEGQAFGQAQVCVVE